MSKRSYDQTVVVPTGGDTLRLRWVLEGLRRQENAPDHWEVIVTGDVNEEGQHAVQSCVDHFIDTQGLTIQGLYLPVDKADQFRAASARNLGIENARGSQIVFLDGDCVPDKDFLAAHHAAISANPNAVCYGFRRQLLQPRIFPFTGEKVGDQEDAYFAMYSEADQREGFGTEQAFIGGWYTCNASAPRALLNKVGRFDAAQFDLYWAGEDLELSWRLNAAGGVLTVLNAGRVTHLDHARLAVRADHADLMGRILRGECNRLYPKAHPEKEPDAEPEAAPPPIEGGI